MMHARVFATIGAIECGAVAGSLAARQFMPADFLPGPSVGWWAVAFGLAAGAQLVGVIINGRMPACLRCLLLVCSGLHAAFAAVLMVYALSQGLSWVGAVLAWFATAMYVREVLRLGGYRW